MDYQPQLPLVGGPDRPVGSSTAGDGDSDWRIDEPTRLAGRRGVTAARAALARSTRPLDERRADAA